MNKKVLITGPTSGTGRYLSEVLAGKGYELILVGRNKGRLKELSIRLSPSKSYIYDHDFSSSLALKQVASKIKSDHQNIDILINNAGILGNDHVKITDEGWEQTFAVNYLSHFVLTSELMPVIGVNEGGIIFNMCSQSYNWYSLDFDDLETKNSYKPMKAYGRSKLMLLMLGQWIADNYKSVTVLNIDPGTFRSGISRSRGLAFRLIYNLAKGFMRSPEDACRDIVQNLQITNQDIPSGAFLKKGMLIDTEINEMDYSRLIEQSVNLTGTEIRNILLK